MYELWEDLKRLKRCRWVELSHPLNNDSPYWGGIPEGAVELSKPYMTGEMNWNV